MSMPSLSGLQKSQNSQEDGRTLSFLSGNLAQVDVAKIERELNRLWDSAGKQEESSWTPVIRACALNVVLLCDDGKNEREFENLLADITVRHPCRAILAVIALAQVEKVEAWVTAHCHFLPGRLDKQMCCEQITVKWSGQSFKSEGLASVVTPLVIPELPSWLFAGSKHLTGAVVEPFLAYLDHLLIDSRFSDEESSAVCQERLKALSEKWQIALDLADRAVVVDLAWLTLSAWRKAIALAFDDTDVSIKPSRLQAVKTITIKYGGAAKGFSQALLLASWLSSRIELEPSGVNLSKVANGSATSLHARYSKTGSSETVELNLVSEEDSCTGISSFEMTFGDGADKLNVDFVGGALRVSNAGNFEYMELPWSSARDKEGAVEPVFNELVDFAFEHYSKDSVFLAAAKDAVSLLASCQC
ncbi:MAG: glucose-6-phosphate dehydrogenase assembly protein OpcA [Candidatus Obscuribacterales bacterium]